MRAAAEATALFPNAARTRWNMSITALPRRPRKRTRSIVCATAPICARARSCLPRSERVTDRYDDEPNNFTFGVYYRGELYSSIRVSVLCGKWRRSPSSEMFSDMLHPELDRGKTIIDPTRFVADPDKAKIFPGTALRHRAAGLCRMRPFQRRYRACQSSAPSTGRSISKVFLQEPDGRTADCSLA